MNMMTLVCILCSSS